MLRDAGHSFHVAIESLLSNMSLYSLRIAVANIRNNADVAKRFWKINAISRQGQSSGGVFESAGRADAQGVAQICHQAPPLRP